MLSLDDRRNSGRDTTAADADENMSRRFGQLVEELNCNRRLARS